MRRGGTPTPPPSQPTWLRSFFGFTDWPLPFDDDWRRKPAYFGMRAARLEAALRAGA